MKRTIPTALLLLCLVLSSGCATCFTRAFDFGEKPDAPYPATRADLNCIGTVLFDSRIESGALLLTPLILADTAVSLLTDTVFLPADLAKTLHIDRAGWPEVNFRPQTRRNRTFQSCGQKPTQISNKNPQPTTDKSNSTASSNSTTGTTDNAHEPTPQNTTNLSSALTIVSSDDRSQTISSPNRGTYSSSTNTGWERMKEHLEKTDIESRQND